MIAPKRKTSVGKILLYVVIAFIVIGIIGSLGGSDSEISTEKKSEPVTKDPTELVEVPKGKILDFEIVRNNDDWSGKKISDVYAILKEKPTNESEINITVRQVAKMYLKRSEHIPDELTVWLYTSETQAKNESLKSEYIAQYWKNFNSKNETFQLNPTKKENLFGNGERTKEIDEVKESLKQKGVDFCQLHTLNREWLKWSDEKSREKYEPDDNKRLEYADKLYYKEVDEFKKKFKISDSLWDKAMEYSSEACD